MTRNNTRRMHQLRDDFFAEGKAQSESPDPDIRALSFCWLDNSSIDYTVPAHTTSDSHNLDHYHSVHDHPELQEDWDNFRHSHMTCNTSRGKRTPSAGLGDPMPDWW